MSTIVHPLLTQKTNINDMEIGDVIPCRYTATTSGTIGSFSELGTCIASEIPITGSSIPNGLFYFIKVDTGKLIADRVIQTNITWDILNNNRYIEGNLKDISLIPPMTDNTLPNGVASASGTRTTKSEDPFNAFNTIIGSNGWHNTANVTSGWLQYKFDNATNITGYGMINWTNYPTAAPKDWTFLGSNDEVNWVELDRQTNQSCTDGVWRKYDFINSQTFLYYRLFITANNGYSNLAISELQMYGNSTSLIRSISGGNSYKDSFNNSSLINAKLGGWPDNDWDTYIVNSDLNGKIVKGDDNIWHWSTIASWCKETPFAGIKDVAGTITAANTHRVGRGYKDSYGNVERFNLALSTANVATWGFRPVLEYKEISSKSTNLYY